MNQPVTSAQHEGLHIAGLPLLTEAEQSMQASFPQEKAATESHAQKEQMQESAELGNRVAWQFVWVKLLEKDYAGAVAWLYCVNDLPAVPKQIWRTQRAAFVGLCEQLQQNVATSGHHSESDTEPVSINQAVPPAPLADVHPLPLSVQSLGAFSVTRGTELLAPCRARKAVALLRYLLTRPSQSASRDELIELLWPDAAPRRVSHSLHVTVSALRNHLDTPAESYVLFSAGSYQINPAASVFNDCTSFLVATEQAEHFRKQGNLEQAKQLYIKAVAYYQGDYALDDYDLAWVTVERERLLTYYLVALEQLGTIWVQQGCYDMAAECFRSLLRRDEYREDIYCALMRCYVQLGRRNDAIKEYHRCEHILNHELGIRPTAETNELYRQMLAI